MVDRGTVEDFATDEWARTEDPDRQRDFVWLLNTCLRRKLYPRIRFRRDIDCYVFLPTLDMGPEAVAYERPDGTSSHRNVFSVHRNKAGDVSYYKHGAAELQFRRFGDQWFLEIQPTYVYTSDGDKIHRHQSELLTGIKRLDRNPAVLGQVLMWADVIRRSGSSESGTYRYLAFGKLAQLALDVGIDDRDWRTDLGEDDEVP